VLDEVLTLCEEHKVDLLLIAGDVFHDRVSGGHIGAARRLFSRLLPQLRNGLSIFLLRGNHDPLDLFQFLSLVLEDLAGESHLPLVVAATPGVYRIPGHELQVVALPYLTPTMLQADARDSGISAESEVAQISGTLAQALERLYGHVSPGVPSIFAGHIFLRGAKITEDLEFESGYHRELWLEPARLPQFTSYNALGHIHLSQPAQGVGKPTWYAGSPDRQNRGEREYMPQVLLVETPELPGGAATVTPLLLTRCTPFIERSLDGEEAIEAFCATVWPEDPLGRVIISGIPTALRPLVETRVRRVAPRVRILWYAAPQAASAAPDDIVDVHDVYGTAAAFLSRSFADRPERLAQLKAALTSLWTDDSGE
jgi:exonuclease SbcD